MYMVISTMSVCVETLVSTYETVKRKLLSAADFERVAKGYLLARERIPFAMQ